MNVKKKARQGADGRPNQDRQTTDERRTTNDEDDEGRAQGQEQTGAPAAYESWREMLEKESPDIVSVCPRWTDCHLEMVTACLEAGAHVYCEKPMTWNLADGDAIVALSKKDKEFVDDMIRSRRWRKLLIDLSAASANRDGTLFVYCLQSISNLGHHREIANRIDQSDYFGVFLYHQS